MLFLLCNQQAVVSRICVQTVRHVPRDLEAHGLGNEAIPVPKDQYYLGRQARFMQKTPVLLVSGQARMSHKLPIGSRQHAGFGIAFSSTEMQRDGTLVNNVTFQ